MISTKSRCPFLSFVVVTNWLLSHAVRTLHSCPEEFFDLLPVVSTCCKCQFALVYGGKTPLFKRYGMTLNSGWAINKGEVKKVGFAK